MNKYLSLLAILFIQALFGSWDTYEGEQLVLFSLAPGIGDQYPKSCQEQMLPSYFRQIANRYPTVQAKVIAIDPSLSEDPNSSEYIFLSGWENEGMTFRKDNISIHYFNEYIPESQDDGYAKRVENYLLKVLENGGVVFIGHHGQAYYAFEPFRTAYNHLNCDNIQMYICCSDVPPFSTPKVYFNNPCSNQELDEFYAFICPHIRDFWDLIYEWEAEDKLEYKDDIEAAYQLLDSLIQGLKTNFIFYKDMRDLPYDVIRHSDGSLQIHLMDAAKAA